MSLNHALPQRKGGQEELLRGFLDFFVLDLNIQRSGMPISKIKEMAKGFIMFKLICAEKIC